MSFESEEERVELKKSLVDEIIKGREQLQVSCFNNNEEQVQLERMLSCYEEALSILTGRAPAPAPAPSPSPQEQSSHPPPPPASSTSLTKPTHSKPARPHLYKRKTRTETEVRTVKIKTPAGEAASDDGYSWRKYGQKIILGSKFPRSYYRCMRGSSSQFCVARKQVQRSDDDPTLFDVTYSGVHTCQCQAAGALPKP